MKNTSKTAKPYPLSNRAPTSHTNHTSYIPLPMPSKSNYPLPWPTSFQIPPLPSKCNIPSGLMNDLPLPPDLQPFLPSLPYIPSNTNPFHPILPILPLPAMISSIPPIIPPIHYTNFTLPAPIIPMLPINKPQTRKHPKLRNKNTCKPLLPSIPINTINPRHYNHPKTHENTDNIDHKIESLPLGHPGRITFIDTMSEAFTDKYKKQKRYVPHRSWARCRKCGQCNKTYPSADDYELHRMVYHSEGIQIHHPCDICGASYNERRWLNRHVRNTHFKFLCKFDGHGTDQETVPNDQLKKRKGKDAICGFRFSCYEDIVAHQAIIHGAVNAYTQHTGDQGPTVKYMNGTDAKNVVIERLVWRKDESDNSDLELDLNDITVTMDGGIIHSKEKKTKLEKRKKFKKRNKKSKSQSQSRCRSRSKSKSPKKKRKNKVVDIPPCIEPQPPLKKRKMNKNENYNELLT